MPTQIALLRGVNLGSRNRIAMPALREALTAAGFAEVRTYVQSGNIVLDTELDGDALAVRLRELLAGTFELDVPVVTRTREELAAVVDCNPLGELATDPKRHQVVFLSGQPDAAAVARIVALASGREAFAARGRELYCWHPDGIARSKLALGVAGRSLGVGATARNWTTVTALLEMAS